MKKKDHLLLGRFLLAKKEAPSGSIKRRLFLFGCVEPDINPFTYMRGSVRHQFLQGHNEENARAHFQKVLEKLNRSGVRTPWQWEALLPAPAALAILSLVYEQINHIIAINIWKTFRQPPPHTIPG